MELRQIYLILASLFLYYGCQSTVIQNGSYFDGNDTSIEYFPLNYDHPCKRLCVKGAPPMVCRYKFKIEWYQTLSKACYSCPEVYDDCFKPDCIIGDGTRRMVFVVNRMMPGPTIDVCVGDRIVVDVENLLISETTIIHWHGHHQRGTPYMDGAPYITQCPIQPGNEFRYNFTAVNAGTHFWHSHIGMQRGDGAYGAFIVHTPEEDDPHGLLYDYDLPAHTISLLDWAEDIGLKIFVSHHHSIGDNKPTNLIVNGLGLRLFENTTGDTPIARFVVEQGYRYRFRLINAGFLNCPIEMLIDNHTITVISSDGNNFKPHTVDSLISYAGERFDFILKADQKKDLYWIRFRGLMDCDERFTSAHQVAVLQYKGMSDLNYPDAEFPTYNSSEFVGALQLNALNKGLETNVSISMPHLHSFEPWDTSLKEEADEKFFISYDFYEIDNPHFHKFPYYGFNNVSDPRQRLLTPQLNHISLKLPPFPVLSQRHQITDNMLCNETSMENENCAEDFCQCTHVIQVKLNSIVELILVDKGFAFDANHPFHLHGHSFRVVGMERLGKEVTLQNVKELDKKGLLKRNLIDAPIKDTVTVPDGGYTILRFNASNPGYWLFHCHIEFHVEIGMALIFKFGEDSDMPPVPPTFPTCGMFYNTLPSDYAITLSSHPFLLVLTAFFSKMLF